MERIYKAVYMGKEYIAADVCKETVLLISKDQQDLKNGFYTRHDAKYFEKNPFACKKTVSTSELSSLIETTFHYIYKGVELEKVGCHRDENGKYMARLGYYIPTNTPQNNVRFKNVYEKYLYDGFTMDIVEKTFCYMVKKIYEDDPNLEITEEIKRLI